METGDNDVGVRSIRLSLIEYKIILLSAKQSCRKSGWKPSGIMQLFFRHSVFSLRTISGVSRVWQAWHVPWAPL